MDLPSSRSPEPPNSKSSKTRPNHPAKTGSPTSNRFKGGDPYSARVFASHQVGTNAMRQRFSHSNSTHRSVQTHPTSSAYQDSCKFDPPTISHSAYQSRAQHSLPRKTGVSRDTTHSVPSLLGSREKADGCVSQAMNRAAPIAHPHHDTSRHFSSSSRPSTRLDQSTQPRASQSLTPKPLRPEKGTIISLGDDEPATHPKSSKLSNASHRSKQKPAPDVVDLDADEQASPAPLHEYTSRNPAQKRPRADSQCQPHAYEGERNRRHRTPSSRTNRNPPGSSKVMASGSDAELVRPPKLKTQSSKCRERSVVNDVGKVIGGGNTPTRIDEQETVIVDEVEVTHTNLIKDKKTSLADAFGHQVKFDKKRADEVMAHCRGERRSLMILSFLGMNDVELHDLWRTHAPPRDDVERSLMLRSNQLTKLTPFLREKMEMWNIRSLDLSHNFLSNECDISHRLRILNLSRNQLSRFPIGIETLTELELLDLSHNNIRKAPRQLCQLKKLEILDLTGNNLEALPDDCFGKESQLEALLISCNFGIDSLPNCATYLTKLKVFQFEKTAIHGHLARADLRLEAAELVNQIAGVDARTLARRKAATNRESRLRKEPVHELDVMT